jgi:hypothetical protein
MRHEQESNETREHREHFGSRERLDPNHPSQSQRKESCSSSAHQIKYIPGLEDSPLIPARIVELPTLVNPKLAFTLQFAANHAKQKTAANEAVSLVESFAWCIVDSWVDSGGEYIGGSGTTTCDGAGVIGWLWRFSAGEGLAERMRLFA